MADNLYNLISLIFIIILTKEVACKVVNNNRGNKNCYVDLSHALYPGMLVFPNSSAFSIVVVAKIGVNDSVAENISTPTHIGTHVDAPSHLFKTEKNIDDIPIENFIGSVCVINIADKSYVDPYAKLTKYDLVLWKQSNGDFSCDFLLVRTDWDRFWGDRLQYIGPNNNTLRFPSISTKAAKWIVDNTNIRGVGIDTISVDISVNLPVHKILLSKHSLVIENLANLKQLPSTGARLYAVPINIKGASGAPARVFAKI
ncbi:uncharacterized protein LOC111635012 isoform X2 [Centruroides sculpturatus]|uniref:uncharacterized protein LOC111635012 isoform X2 n=1 Tax=Centruroides sculpturatus TaxID=218467 RepID=UPI000C6D98B6|nr:uncharacterized protein LOC111635012 isoform X2 [Centruroides sculpturatus]